MEIDRCRLKKERRKQERHAPDSQSEQKRQSVSPVGTNTLWERHGRQGRQTAQQRTKHGRWTAQAQVQNMPTSLKY